MKFNLKSIPSYEFDTILKELEVFKNSKLRYLIIQEISALISHQQRSEGNDSYKLGSISQLLDLNSLIQVDLEKDIKIFMNTNSGNTEQSEDEYENEKKAIREAFKKTVLAKKQ